MPTDLRRYPAASVHLARDTEPGATLLSGIHRCSILCGVPGRRAREVEPIEILIIGTGVVRGGEFEQEPQSASRRQL